jgi:2-dehydropantoate 2-reductase
VVGRDTIAVRKVPVLADLAQLKGQPLHTLFICTKTWSLKEILPALKEVLDPEALVISFQNGIGPEDDVARLFPKENVARGIVNYAGGISEDTGTSTLQWFNPPNYLGPVNKRDDPRLEELSAILSRAGLTTETIPHDETRKQVFYKTILNSALNALCAASGITMRAAMTYRHTRNLARMLIREGLQVATAVGYHYGEWALAECMQYLDKGGDHLPSMYYDLKARRRTEIEYINGKIVKVGLMFKQVDVDANMFFTAAIVTQEIKAGVREPEDIPEYLTHF